MAKHKEESAAELLLEKITDKFHGGDLSSSDSDDEKSSGTSAAVAAADAVKAKIYCLFEREKPIHTVLGGGKHMHQVRWLASEGDVLSNSSNLRNNLCAAADLFLWRDKKISAATLGLATAIWIFFELMEYHLLTLICHGLILSLAIIFLWSNASTFINKSRPHIPEVSIPEDLVLNIAHSLRYEINWVLAALREIALGRDLKKFLIAIAELWFLSIVGNCFNFLTLFYIAFVTLHTVPILYEKYEGKVDAFAEKAEIEFKKHYAVIHAKYSSKIPMGPLKDKKIQ